MAKWMKSFLKSFLFLSVLTVGVGLFYAWRDQTRIKEGKKGHYHLHLSDDWEYINGLNADAVIQSGNKDHDAYIVAIPYEKCNYENAETFYRYLLDYMHKLYEDYQLISSEKLLIDHHDAYELTGVLQFEDVQYRNFVYGISYEDCYLLVMAWAPESSDEKLFAEMKLIVSTLHQE